MTSMHQRMSRLLRVWVIAAISLPTMASAQSIEVVLGTGSNENAAVAKELKLTEPFGVDFDRAGNMYVAEMTLHRIKKIAPDGKVTLVAGTGEKGFGGDGGDAKLAKLDGPHHLMMGPEDDLYIADTWNGAVRKIGLKDGKISTVAGNGVKGYSGDGGPATQAQCAGVYSIAWDATRTRLFIADLENRRIRMVNRSTGIMTTVAGNGQKGIPKDGELAVHQPLVDPRAVAMDSKDNLYILERGGHALRVVDRDGKIRTVVGTGKAGYSGNGQKGLLATLNGPKHLAIDRDDTVLILDTENHVLRRYDPKTEVIDLVIGSGKKGTNTSGGYSSVEMFRPHGILVHTDGSYWISDSSNGRVLHGKRGS